MQLSFVLLLFALNYRGLQLSASLQLGLTLVISAIVATVFIQLGWSNEAQSLEINNASSDKVNLILTASGLAFWSFLGIEAMSHLSGDFKNPKKDLVPAIMIGTILVGCIFLACTYLVLSVPSATELHMVDAFNQVFGQGGQMIIGSLGIAGGLATVNVYNASLSRLMWSFANDGVLPSSLRYKNQYGVPVRALLVLLTTISVVLIIADSTGIDLEQLLSGANGVFAIIYFASMLAAFKLLKRKYRSVISLGCMFLFFNVLGLRAKYAVRCFNDACTSSMYLVSTQKQRNSGSKLTQ